MKSFLCAPMQRRRRRTSNKCQILWVYSVDCVSAHLPVSYVCHIKISRINEVSFSADIRFHDSLYYRPRFLWNVRYFSLPSANRFASPTGQALSAREKCQHFRQKHLSGRCLRSANDNKVNLSTLYIKTAEAVFMRHSLLMFEHYCRAILYKHPHKYNTTLLQ